MNEKNMIKIAMDVFKNMVMFQFPMLNNQKINHRDLPPREKLTSFFRDRLHAKKNKVPWCPQ
jgi:hypothetical protein